MSRDTFTGPATKQDIDNATRYGTCPTCKYPLELYRKTTTKDGITRSVTGIICPNGHNWQDTDDPRWP